MKNWLFVFLLFSSVSLAQVPINKGEPAPEDGVFLSKERAAEIIAEREFFDKKLRLELDFQEKRLKAVCDGEKEIKDIKLSIEKEKNKDIIQIKDKQIKALNEILEKESHDYSMWWFAGGATVATIASVTIFFAATQIEKSPSLLGN